MRGDLKIEPYNLASCIWAGNVLSYLLCSSLEGLYLDASCAFQIHPNAMLNLVSLLPFPDLGSTDPRFHDQLNSSVESFILQFGQTGYCMIAWLCCQVEHINRGFDSSNPQIGLEFTRANWTRSTKALYVASCPIWWIIFFASLLAGRNVSSSKWTVTRSEHNNFKGFLRFQHQCC